MSSIPFDIPNAPEDEEPLPHTIYTCNRCMVTKKVRAALVPATLTCVICRSLIAPRFIDDEGGRL